eukprot:scaffold243035_cov42-Prasinocladus_malaysianus.AAC.1
MGGLLRVTRAILLPFRGSLMRLLQCTGLGDVTVLWVYGPPDHGGDEPSADPPADYWRGRPEVGTR